MLENVHGHGMLYMQPNLIFKFAPNATLSDICILFFRNMEVEHCRIQGLASGPLEDFPNLASMDMAIFPGLNRDALLLIFKVSVQDSVGKSLSKDGGRETK
ncbi:hypothetical protein AbraCBS73388_010979, partial [Aspergillus brasiliensis]